MNEIDSSFNPGEISDWFWNIIHQADKSRENLRNLLMSLGKEELIRFQDEFLEAAAQLNDEPYVNFIDPDESEDGVEDICNWVVSQGKHFYTQVWEHPPLIPLKLGDPNDLYGVAGEVFWERFGEEIQDWMT